VALIHLSDAFKENLVWGRPCMPCPSIDNRPDNAYGVKAAPPPPSPIRNCQEPMEINLTTLQPRFVELFKGTFGFDEHEFSRLISAFRVQVVRKRELYLRAGEISHAKAYVNKGCSRNFVLDEKGHERIISFAFEDWWLADFESYYSGKPGTTYIQMLEDSELLVISKESFQRLEKDIPKLKQWYTTKVTRHASALLNWIEKLSTLNPEERYLDLLKEQPQIVRRVPLQYVAAYLNIEPQSLSRIRHRLAKNH
jgi:CRP-like cAMP-binding protein